MRGRTVQQRPVCWQEDGEYVCLGAAAGCVSGACCLAGSSDSGPLRRALREPKWICLGYFGSIIWQDASGKTSGGHAAENLLLCGVMLVHLCSLLSGVGKCGHGLLGHV